MNIGENDGRGHLANLRRLYLHVLHGGQIQPHDEARFGGEVTLQTLAAEIIRLEQSELAQPKESQDR